jgi:hypothetical protein
VRAHGFNIFKTKFRIYYYNIILSSSFELSEGLVNLACDLNSGLNSHTAPEAWDLLDLQVLSLTAAHAAPPYEDFACLGRLCH